MTLLMNTLLEPLLTPPSHSLRSFPSTPLSLSTTPFLLLTSPPSDLSPLLSQPLFLDLSLPPRQHRMLQPCFANSESTLPHLSHPTANASRTKPLKCLLFRSPLPKGKGVKQALAWNQEQLLDLRRLWELRWQRCVSAGLLPMTQPPTMISDAVLDVENSASTAMGIPPSSQTPHLTSRQPNLESQCQDPFRPTTW
jgi:hypothetical protein